MVFLLRFDGEFISVPLRSHTSQLLLLFGGVSFVRKRGNRTNFGRIDGTFKRSAYQYNHRQLKEIEMVNVLMSSYSRNTYRNTDLQNRENKRFWLKMKCFRRNVISRTKDKNARGFFARQKRC